MISTEAGEINANLCKDQAVPNKAVMATIILGSMGTFTQIVICLRLDTRWKLAPTLELVLTTILC
jgi:hypothetical protein